MHLETCQDTLEHELSVALQCLPCGWLPSPPSTFSSNPFYFSFCIVLLMIVRIHKILVWVVFTWSFPYKSVHFLRRGYIYIIFLTWASTVSWHIKGVWQMINWIKLLKINSISFFSYLFVRYCTFHNLHYNISKIFTLSYYTKSYFTTVPFTFWIQQWTFHSQKPRSSY